MGADGMPRLIKERGVLQLNAYEWNMPQIAEDIDRVIVLCQVLLMIADSVRN